MQDINDLESAGHSLRFSYKQLSTATNQFQEESLLGQGGFGSVHRGVMPTTGQVVAVKRVSDGSKQGLREFVAEVMIISELRHKNIVKLLGWCYDRGSFMLVYELMPNGSLDKALFKPEGGKVLPWHVRFSILRGAAETLQYLHEGTSSRKQIIHRDIKSSNILLDEEYNAMLGDFGLAKIMDRFHGAATTKVVSGTPGYIAPEALVYAKFTGKTDVFAFGAVVLEVVTGEAAYSKDYPEDEQVLADCVWKSLEEGTLMRTVDTKLEVYDEEQAEVLLLLGLLCSHPDPTARPSMSQVLDILSGSLALPPVPASKPKTHYDEGGRQLWVKPLRSNQGTDSSSTTNSSFLSLSKSTVSTSSV
ncbi:hypothetical protein Mapa_002402 [Marchantia paleacea]|nr:hypothetical protein Mapa_002402 [Marchantia paleacea]